MYFGLGLGSVLPRRMPLVVASFKLESPSGSKILTACLCTEPTRLHFAPDAVKYTGCSDISQMQMLHGFPLGLQQLVDFLCSTKKPKYALI
ncbi:hypothetical protein XENTR_v10007910 [Xenopus tropicalis]|nr:hypothetical protein XENTR_v10007910 [Xenopus tropicalis]